MEGVPYRSTMNKKIDKAALASRILALEGIAPEDKSALLELLSEQKRYGLVWEDKPEVVEEELRSKLPVLTEVKERQIMSEDSDAPNHILIEGDNLHALSALAYTHEGKIDLIYIDPPYNRGENDFMYNDKYIDKDNPFKHSLWLAFISKRLRLAKRLLSDKGVLIVHIDEHEFDALHLLLENDIFDETRNMGMIIWNKLNPKGDAHNVAVMHEYILIFCNNKEIFTSTQNALMRDKPNAETIIKKATSLWKKIGKKEVPFDIYSILKSYKYSNRKIDEFAIEYSVETVKKEFQQWLKKNDFSKGEKAYKYLDKEGQVFRTVSMAWPNKDIAPADYWIPLRHPITGEECPIPSKGWRNPPLTMNALLGDKPPIIYEDNLVVKGEIAFSRKKSGALNIPERVYYLKDNMMENVSSIYNDGSSDEQLLSDLCISFPYPKCLSVAKYLLNNVLRCNDATILDFFAGSGTTLHATMQLNAEDGGHRQCILVTNNENNICEDVTYERNKRVIQGYTTPKGQQVEGLKNNNLRYYKVDFVDREKTAANQKELMKASTDLLCIKENLYQEETCFEGLKLHEQIARCFSDGTEGGKKMLIIYEPAAIPVIVKRIEQMTVGKENKLKVYVMAEGQYPYTEDFESVLSKVELRAMPHALYQAMRQVLPSPAEAENTEPEMEVSDEEADGSIYKSEEQ